VTRQQKPRVTVVLTTFNRANVLETTVQTILDQAFQDFQLLIADDCSTDGTEDTVATLMRADPRVRYLRQPMNVGMPANLNSAIAASTGEYVANLHDGDIYRSDLLARWIEALGSCPRAAFVFNACEQLAADGSVERTYLEPLPPCFPGRLLIESIYHRRWHFGSPVWGTVMARRTAYESVGPFQARFGFVSDVDMWLRLAEDHDVAYVPEPLIALASSHGLPRQWGAFTPAHEKRTVRRIFWESRLRHYRGRLLFSHGQHVPRRAPTATHACGSALRDRASSSVRTGHGSAESTVRGRYAQTTMWRPRVVVRQTPPMRALELQHLRRPRLPALAGERCRQAVRP
jgi:glycosyltransferase involved in cell wall biosynthesis